MLNRTKVQSNKAMARSLAQSRLGGQGSRTVSMQVSVIGRNCTVPFGVRRSEDAESRQVGQSGLRITFDAQQGGPGFVQPQRVTRECFREEMTMP